MGFNLFSTVKSKMRTGRKGPNFFKKHFKIKGQTTRDPRIKDVCNSLNVSVEKGVVNLANFIQSDNLDEAEKVQVSLENES